MKGINNKIAITLVCIILGIMLAIQFKTVNQTVGGIIPSQRAQQLAIELKNLQDEKEKLLEELNNLESRVKEYEKNAADENIYIKTLSEDIDKYKMLAGYEDVQGPGVTIIIDDPPMEVQYGDDVSLLIYNYDLLLEIISILNVSGAEAISINDQRITSYSAIVPVGNQIKVNGVPFVPPFVVKAIGDTRTLESALNFPGGIISRLREYNFDVQIKTNQNIQIPRSTKIKEFRYAKPIKTTTN